MHDTLHDALAAAGLVPRRCTPGEQRLACPACNHGKRDDALALRLDSDGSARWQCFRCGLVGRWRPLDASRPTPRPPASDPIAAQRKARALQMWRGAVDRGIAGTPAETYLRNRGIDPNRLMTEPPGWPETLIFSDDASTVPGRVPESALVVAINDAESGLVCAVHRIFLHSDGSPVRDDRGRKIKLALGPVRGNAARLSCWPDYGRGRWGIAEGVETALASRQLFQIPTWSAISAGNMVHVAPPYWARHCTIIADHDEPGLAAAQAAAARYREYEHVESVRIVRASRPGADAADMVTETAHG